MSSEKNDKINIDTNKDIIDQTESTQEGMENLDINKNIEDTGIAPVIVKYCELCHFPEEYCENSHPIVFKKQSAVVQEEKKEEAKEGEATTTGVKTEEKTEVKEKKKPKETFVIIELSKRGKRKHTTYVNNLEKFGLVLKDVAKLFSKKFACSSSVQKEENGTESIVLTGEFGYDLVDFLVEKYPNIKAENCQVKEPKVKKEE